MSNNNDIDSTYSRQGWPNPASHGGRDGRDQDQQKVCNSSFGPYVFGSLVFFIAILGACPFILRRFGCVSDRRRRRRRVEYAVGENDGGATRGVDRHKLIESSLITTKVISHNAACGRQRSEEDEEGDKSTYHQTSQLESGTTFNYNDQQHSSNSDELNNNRDLDTFVNQKYSLATTGKEEGQLSTPSPEVKDDGRNSDYNGILCHICLECLQVGDNVSWAASSSNTKNRSIDEGKNEKCQHVFHNKCIVEWLRQHDDCPCCRRAVLQTLKIHVPASGDESASVGVTTRQCVIEADDMDEEKGNSLKSDVDEKYVFCVVHGIVHKRV